MPYFTYDTSVCVSRKLINFQEMPESFLMSAVVLMELAQQELETSHIENPMNDFFDNIKRTIH